MLSDGLHDTGARILPRPAWREGLLALYQLLVQSGSPRRWHRVLLTLIHGSIALVRETQRDRIHVRAATLAYWTLVAIVPMLLLAFSLMGPLGLLDNVAVQVRTALYSSVLAGSISDVAAYLDSLVGTIRLDALGIVGFLGVLLTGSKMYFNVEQAYNDIFNVRLRRSWIIRITLFYAVITLGPLLLSAGFVATSRLGTTLPPGLLGRAVPVACTTLAFVLAIKLLPQVNVRWAAALAGGLASAILFETAKFGFGAYTLLLAANSSAARIYGSLGLLPVFLTWLYLLWLITLVGVELAYVVQHGADLVARERARLQAPDDLWRHPDAFFGLQVLAAISSRYLAGCGPAEITWVAGRLGSTTRAVVEAVDILERARLLLRMEGGTFVPAMPPDDIHPAHMLLAYRACAVPASQAETRLAGPLRHALETLSTAGLGSVGDLARLMDGDHPDPSGDRATACGPGPR